MKYAFAAIALAAVARAQTLADIPECAIPCLDKSITDNTDCKTTDLVCVCKNFDAVQGDATACVLKECGSDVAINEVLPAAQKLCENPPSAGGEETTSAAPPAETSSKVEESKPAESEPAEQTSAGYPQPPAETSAEPTPIPLPSPTDVVEPPTTEPEVTPVPTAAAASVGYMGGLAMALLGALAL